MEVDASMSTNSDHDLALANHHDGSGEPSSPPTPAAGQGQPVLAGPRPAPTYRVVNAVIEKKEDGPGCRCGHTLTAVPPVGEEGTPGYIGQRLILFGGATALEGNSAAPPSPAGTAGIRLAGATADVHCYDVLSNKWTRLTPLGEPPSPRAAHVATAVGTMVVIQVHNLVPYQHIDQLSVWYVPSYTEHTDIRYTKVPSYTERIGPLSNRYISSISSCHGQLKGP
ncbi:hypothetical protein BHE74_00047975 [Ensete ventricosum]|nr:hypothetical protein BHE74_00047975 [Ensete ventricosum]